MSNARTLNDVLTDGAKSDNPLIALFSQLRLAEASPLNPPHDGQAQPITAPTEINQLETMESARVWLAEAAVNPNLSDLVNDAGAGLLGTILYFVKSLESGNANLLKAFGIRSAKDVPYVSDVLMRIVNEAAQLQISAISETAIAREDVECV